MPANLTVRAELQNYTTWPVGSETRLAHAPFSHPCLLQPSSLVVWWGGWQLQILEETCYVLASYCVRPRPQSDGVDILFNFQKVTSSLASFLVNAALTPNRVSTLILQALDVFLFIIIHFILFLTVLFISLYLIPHIFHSPILVTACHTV